LAKHNKSKKLLNSYRPANTSAVIEELSQVKNDCGSCCDLFDSQKTNPLNSIKILHEYFPLIESAADFKADLILGRGITVKDGTDAEIAKLNAFLTTNNHQGVIKNQIKSSLIYGHSLIRLITLGTQRYLQPIAPFNFFLVNIPTDVVGFFLPNLYVVTTKENTEKSHYEQKITVDKDGLLTFKQTNELYTLLPSEVIHLKINESNAYGKSPFLFDKLRIQLGFDVLSYNITDAGNGGVNKLLVALKENIDPRSLGLNEIEGQDPVKYTQAIQEIAKANKETINKNNNLEPRKNAVTIYNKSHIESIDKSSVDVRSIEYMQYIQGANTELVCSALGLHPALFMSREGGASATSLQPILEYTVNVLTKPAVELFETQVLSKIRKFLGISNNLIFEPLDLSNPLDVASVKEKLANVAEKTMGLGVNSNEVYDFINKNILENTNTEKERLFSSNLKSEETLKDTIIVQ
jgi:hypothetical protein